MSDIYEILVSERKSQMLALCTIVNTHGSTPRKTGAKMIVFENGTSEGTIGGGELEKKVIRDAVCQMEKKEARLFRHDLLHHHAMCCGGTVDVYIEPVMKKNKLYIFGAGHTGQALCTCAVPLGFEVVLIDDRKEFIQACRMESVNKMHLPFNQALQLLPFDESTYVCIMTYNHALDRNILWFCMERPHAYLGMIGSKRKVEITKKIFLEARPESAEKINAVDMPMGIDIHAEGPGEIAISIISKLIQVKNKALK